MRKLRSRGTDTWFQSKAQSVRDIETIERKPKRKTRTKEDELREKLAQLMSPVTEPEEDEFPQTLI